VHHGESRYLVQRLSGGTKCDLTGRDRRVEVQFHCNTQPPTDRITLIKETSTCAYLMVIHTPRLCNDVAFLPPQKDSPNAVSCTPILDETQVDDYKRDMSALRAADKEARVWEAQPEVSRNSIGNIHTPPISVESRDQV
jgi:protein OS-9